MGLLGLVKEKLTGMLGRGNPGSMDRIRELQSEIEKLEEELLAWTEKGERLRLAAAIRKREIELDELIGGDETKMFGKEDHGQEDQRTNHRRAD